MSFEFVAARILSAHFGGSMMVWGGLISVIMAGLCLGSVLGAKVTKFNPKDKDMSFYLFLSSIGILFTSLGQNTIIELCSSSLSMELAILVSSTLIYAIPSILLGMTSPLLVHLKAKLDINGSAGYTSGVVSAYNTMGSIIGTLFVSFYWIPAMGLMGIGLCLSMALMVLAGVISARNS
jgi:predicted membrane-bound spermidine synthase